MRILLKNLKKQELKLLVESQDDLWSLSQVVDSGDFVKARTFRKIKLGSDERKARVVRKPVFLKIRLEKADFSGSVLRLSGVVVEAPEDVPRGSHHTLSIEEQSVLSIVKEKWLRFQLGRIEEACSGAVAKILICVFDREEAFFALMKRHGYELLMHIEGDVQKKAVEDKKDKSFYPDIIKQMEDYDKRMGLQSIILASPSFFKEDLMKFLRNDGLKRKIIHAACSSVSANGIDEVLKRDEVRKALSQDRITQELNLVERLLAEISKDALAVYGLKETEDAANAGAVAALLITDRLIRKSREQGSFSRIDAIMRLADSMDADVRIISSEHDGGRKLDGLGGIAALLRYRLSY